MTLEEKIKKKAEGFGKLAPTFLEGTEFALNNQWISVDDDLPCNHKELIDPMLIGACEETVLVVVWNGSSEALDYMTHIDNEWKWYHNESNTHWCQLPELQNKN